MQIRIDDLNHRQVHALLRTHMDSMHQNSPPESVHALGLDALRQPDITFWTAWDGLDLMGCGALKDLGGEHGEIKSMRTATQHLRKGVAAAILQEILRHARQKGYQRLSLETGPGDAFASAHRLYERFGFQICGPFASYADDPYSLFMTRTVDSCAFNLDR